MAAVPADAVPHKRTLEVERQIVMDTAGYGCTTDTLIATFPRTPHDVLPGVGDWLHGRAFVLSVDVVGQRVTWTVGPDAETCASHPGDEWYWETGEASFTATYRDRFYVVNATRRDGVRTVGGLPTRWRDRQGPSIRRAKRVLGRPTSIQGSKWGRTACHVRWARLGLRATFSNFGGRRACKSGLLQTARISGQHARRWAVLIDGKKASPATVGTSLRYLREGELARYNYASEAWALSQVWLPYGEAGYYSAVSARLMHSDEWDGGNPVGGFDLYVGAAGD